MMPKNQMRLISSRELLKTPIFRVTEDVAKDPDGFEIKRAIVQHAGSAVVMALDARSRILLVRQYRLPARDYLWELPAGRLDPGETPLQAAKRELMEETGYRARRWRRLASFFASPGYVAEKMTIFVARDLTQGDATPMEDERIRISWFTPPEVEAMIAAGRIADAKTIIGFYRWRDLRKALA
jgi:ADP-ribose pyrophosphatase